jgi:hypothetical protein
MMTTPSRTCRFEGCSVEVPGVLEKEGLCLNHYLEEAFRKLGTATEEFNRGEDVDYPAMDWLLAQVDFVVGLAEEDTDLDSDQRSRLLELLLGVANLNEYVRHSTVVARPSH